MGNYAVLESFLLFLREYWSDMQMSKSDKLRLNPFELF